MDRTPGNSTLTILNVAYPLMPVGSDSAGGAEQILHLVDRGLSHRGVRSLVIAAEGSCVEGQLMGTPAAPSQMTDRARADAQAVHARQIQSALSRYRVDLIHYHGLDFLTYWASESRVPQLATLHLPVSWYPPDLFQHPGLSLNCVSHSQAASVRLQDRPSVVSNGVAVETFRPASPKEKYLLWLGRICPEKGTHIALRVAHTLNLPLLVAGPVHPFAAHQTYFAEEVAPLLDDQRRLVGPVGLAQKAELLAEAKCLLVPSLAPETSSLVAMESISSGTPVIAFRSGALPEIVENGVTGFIVDSEASMAEAVMKAEEISPRICRARAQGRFTAERMVADYLDLYRNVIAAAVINA